MHHIIVTLYFFSYPLPLSKGSPMFLVLFFNILLAANITYTNSSFKIFISTIIPLREDGKISIPAHIQHIKLDIGLSYSAPMSQHWLTREDNLMVFGFEPNPAAVESILNGATKRHPSHGTPLEKRFIGKTFFLIPCALGLSQEKSINFFITKNDCGCSSFYEPKNFEVERIITVPIFSLIDFFELFPFDTHPIIDYIKIDAQGADLDIVKSAGNYLKEHVIYITLEPENLEYKNTRNSKEEIQTYMDSIGFVEHKSSLTNDPTYFNPRFAQYIQEHAIEIYQIQ